MSNWKIYALIALIVYAYLNKDELGLDLPSFPSGGAHSEVDPRFNIDRELNSKIQSLPENLKSLVKNANLKGILENSSNGRDKKFDALMLGNYYRDYARIIASDKEKIKTTGQIREANQNAGALMFKSLEIHGAYNGLGEAIDKVMVDSFGLDNRSLDTESNGKILRDQVVDTFLTISEEFYSIIK